MRYTTLLAALILFPVCAQAGDTGPYLGVDAGYSRARINFSDKDSTAYGAYAGYFVTPKFALEAGYRELGDFGSATATAASLAGLWMVPINDRLDFYFKVGVARTSVEAPAVSAWRTAALVGIGAQYELSRAFFSRLSWERYPKAGGNATGEGSIDFFGVGLGLRF